MKNFFVSNLKVNTQVKDVFFVKSFSIRQKKTGQSYLVMELADRTGSIPAIMWECVDDVADKIKQNDFVHINGDVGIYQDNKQLTIRTIKKVKEDSVEPKDFLPLSPNNYNEMFEQFKKYISMIEDKYLRELVDKIFEDKKILGDFLNAPAATQMHHSYIHGLLEHTLGVVKNCLSIAENYPDCNRDLLIVGAILHDIGKIKEFSFKRSIQYTMVGRLEGHITIGIEMIEDKLRKIKDFPEETKILLKHMMLSHHRLLEFGSPKRPKTLEALVLSYSDIIDAEMNTYISELKKARESNLLFTNYMKMFERQMYVGGSIDNIRLEDNIKMVEES